MKITEKQLKARCTELNQGALKETPFGVRIERTSKGYTCHLVYRDNTPPDILLTDASAAEADACISGVTTTTAVFRTIKDKVKPEFVPQEIFVKQGGERCPKCGSRDIRDGRVKSVKAGLEQFYGCERCGTAWYSYYALGGYEPAPSAGALPVSAA